MHLHEAIKKARKELGMSQQKLADLAGIERKQLSILESGGNVTLATVRKVVAHLPNMQPFTLGEAIGTIAPAMAPQAQAEMAQAAMKMMGTILQQLAGALAEGRLPNDQDGKVLDDTNRAFYRSLGFTDQEYDREREAIAGQLPPQPAVIIEKETAATVAMLTDELSRLKLDLGDEREPDQETESPPEARS